MIIIDFWLQFYKFFFWIFLVWTISKIAFSCILSNGNDDWYTKFGINYIIIKKNKLFWFVLDKAGTVKKTWFTLNVINKGNHETNCKSSLSAFLLAIYTIFLKQFLFLNAVQYQKHQLVLLLEKFIIEKVFKV